MRFYVPDGQANRDSLKAQRYVKREKRSRSGSKCSTDSRGVSDANAEYMELLEHAHDNRSVESDVWGCVIYVLVKDLPDVASNAYTSEQMLRLLFVTFLGAMNLTFQFAFLYWIGSYVMLPSILKAQDVYQDFHELAFDKKKSFLLGNFHQEMQDDMSRLCGNVLDNYNFLFAVLFLWFSRAIHEVIKIYNLFQVIIGMPPLPDGMSVKDMVYEEGAGNVGADNIVCIEKYTRWSLLIMVVIPKVLIGVSLLFMGLVWLTSSEHYADLILNSLALGFVLDIDSLLYESFAPPRLAMSLNRLEFAMPVKDLTVEEQAAKTGKEMRDAYIFSFFTLVFAFAAIYIFTHHQPVLPSYEWDVYEHCASYITKQESPWCKFWAIPELGCFPHAKSKEL